MWVKLLRDQKISGFRKHSLKNLFLKGGARSELYYTDEAITSFEFAFLLAVTIVCAPYLPIRKQKYSVQ